MKRPQGSIRQLAANQAKGSGSGIREIFMGPDAQEVLWKKGGQTDENGNGDSRGQCPTQHEDCGVKHTVAPCESEYSKPIKRGS